MASSQTTNLATFSDSVSDVVFCNHSKNDLFERFFFKLTHKTDNDNIVPIASVHIMRDK